MMLRTRNTTPSRPQLRRVAFTLIELIVVIAIIALLVTISVPSIASALQAARMAKTRAHLMELANAATLYKSASGNKYYPGQRYTEELMGSDPAGSYTGSQVLAASVYGFDLGGDPNNSADPIYAEYRVEYVFTPTTGGPGNTLSDIGKNPMPILYYPSRIAQTGLAQYDYDDNSAYGNGAESEANFEARITDDRFDPNDAVNPGEFLLVAPGTNRTYFDSDDIKNW